MSLTTARRDGDQTSPPAPPRPAAPHQPVKAPARPRRRWLRPFLFLLLPAALVAGGYSYVTGGQVMSTENAYVRADMLGVSTDVSGIVKRIAVRQNQPVKAGDLLFTLDDAPFRYALARAEAQLGIVTNDIAALKASYRDMQAQIAQAQVDVDFYSREQDRQRQLVARNFASEAAFDQARRNLQFARQKVASLNQQLGGIVANLAGDPDIALERHPRYLEAVAEREEAARQLAHTTVRAPMDGTVTNVPSLQPGQYLAAATPAFSIVAADRLWVDADPKETELTNVLPGQVVTVTIDTYPGVEWHGTVDSINPASSGSFSLLPAQNSSGNWVKVVQRIPMRVRIDDLAGKPQLRAGMSAVIAVDTGRPRGLPSFVQDLLGPREPSGTALAASSRG